GQELLAPGVDVGRVDAEVGGQLVDGPVALQRRQGDLSLERRRVPLSLAFHRYPFLAHRCSLTGGPVFGVHYRDQKQAIEEAREIKEQDEVSWESRELLKQRI